MYRYIGKKIQCSNAVHRLPVMPFCFYLKIILIFRILLENHTFLKTGTQKIAFFPKKFFVLFSFLIRGTPMNNYAKYQHLKQNFFKFFLKNH